MRIYQTWIPALSALAISFVLSGCKEEEKYSLLFSHALHVTDMEMACSDCHGDLDEPSFTTISHATCLDCHEEPDAEEISVDTCGMCHQEKQLKHLETPAEDAKDGVARKSLFVHTEVLADKCMDCHGELMSEDLELVPRLDRKAVLKIRNAAHLSGQACTMCHIDLAVDQEPASHDLLWTKRHGVMGSQPDAACSVCHSEDSCTECHSVMEPQSHNNLWRLKTHGVEARWDRQSCAVCHEEDSCASCHSQVQPRSHRARWSENHCYGCHTSAQPGEGCVVCHEDGNNVLLHEEIWPNYHNLFGNQANCYECHNPYNK